MGFTLFEFIIIILVFWFWFLESYVSLFCLFVVLNSAAQNPANITANINSIPMLNGTNFKSWQENLLIILGVMDLDLALRVQSPLPLTDESTWNKIERLKGGRNQITCV